MKIVECKVNHICNPVGYRMERTVFSWKVEGAKGKRQSNARIRVAQDEKLLDCIWDTGMNGELDSLAVECELTLLPGTRYYWEVSVVSDTGEEAVSEVQFFETDKMSELWTASWIGCSIKSERHPKFMKTILPQKEVERARLYICGLGLYEAYLGGKRIGQEYLTPYLNAYDKWLQYQTYDVTELLYEAGSGSRLEVLLGDGWYKGRFGFRDPEGKGTGYYGSDWKLIAELHLKYSDGTSEVVGTDESWEVSRSNLTFSNIYDGEKRDDTLTACGAEPAMCVEAPQGILTGRMSVPVVIQERIEPVELIHTPLGEQVLDLGQNFAGIFRLRVKEKKGTKVHLEFGEVLQNGNFYRDNLRSAKAEYSYVSDGSEILLEPHFTFFGYRYVKIEGIADLKKEDFTGLALYSSMQETGTLYTGNPMVNQLVSNTRWGLKSNFLDVPTDCPQRDERMGWTGDAQVFSATACYLEDAYAFFAKYLYDIRQEQGKMGGKVPHVVPSVGETMTSSVWGDAACIIPWNLYLMYGDKDILRAQFNSMKSWVDYITGLENEGKRWGEEFHYGDWLALDNKLGGADSVMGATDVDFIACVYYRNSALLVAKAAEVLGFEEEKGEYLKLAEGILKFIRYEYFTPNGRCCINTQTAMILALKCGLTENGQWTRKRLRKLFLENSDKLMTGFVGTPLLCPLLSENGMGDLAYSLLLNEEYPGWIYEIKLGATTIWERWNSVLEDGSISSTGMNSLNHYSYGSITEWLFAYAAGIRQEEGSTGFRKALLAPEVDWRLKELKAGYNSPAGRYQSSWKILDKKHLELEVVIPFGCEAALVLPHAGKETSYQDKSNTIFEHVHNGVCHLKAGSYHVIYETDILLDRTYSVDTKLHVLLENEQVKQLIESQLPNAFELPVNYEDSTLRKILMLFTGMNGIPTGEGLEALIAQLEERLNALN